MSIYFENEIQFQFHIVLEHSFSSQCIVRKLRKLG